jgi:hypothetical protein
VSSQMMGTLHFRKSKWGDSRESVISAEATSPDISNESSLGWFSRMMDFACLLVYSFDEHGLARGGYVFDEPDDGMDGVIYSRLRESLTGKYGDGQEDINWLNPIRRVNIDTIGDLGNAAGAHYLSATSHWETPTQSLFLSLEPKSNEYGAQVLLNYFPRAEATDFRPAAADLDLL